MNWTGKTYWLVGASEGLGREVAKKIAAAGAKVVVSARSEDRLKSLVEEIGENASYVTVDVTDSVAVDAAAKQIGHIDGVVYLAGVYWPMKASEWDNEKADLMTEINYLGGSRVVGSVIIWTAAGSSVAFPPCFHGCSAYRSSCRTGCTTVYSARNDGGDGLKPILRSRAIEHPFCTSPDARVDGAERGEVRQKLACEILTAFHG